MSLGRWNDEVSEHQKVGVGLWVAARQNDNNRTEEVHRTWPIASNCYFAFVRFAFRLCHDNLLEQKQLFS